MSARTPVPNTPPVEAPPEIVRVQVEAVPGKVRAVSLPAGAAAGRKLHYEVTLEPVPGVPGLWKEVRRMHQPHLKLTDDMEGLEDTGLTRRDVLTLAFAGMVKASRPGLQTTLVDPASLWSHIYKTRLGPDGGAAAEFWQVRDNVRNYSEASQDVVARGLVSRDVYKEAREQAAGQAMLELL